MRRVFIFAGQSNAAGGGARSALPLASYDTGATYSKPTLATLPMLYQSDNAGSPANAWGPFQGARNQTPPVYNEEDLYGPELSFLWKYKAANPTHDLAAIKCAHGGTAIEAWLPSGGTSWPTLQTMINQAAARLTAAGETYRWEALIWMQGETGAHDVYKQLIEPAMGDQFMAHTRTFLTAVRALTRSDLPAVIGRVGDHLRSSWGLDHLFSNDPGYTRAQYSAAVDRRQYHQEQVGGDSNNLCVRMDGLPQRANTADDWLHWSDAGYLAVGERFYAGYQRLVAPPKRLTLSAGGSRYDFGITA